MLGKERKSVSRRLFRCTPPMITVEHDSVREYFYYNTDGDMNGALQAVVRICKQYTLKEGMIQPDSTPFSHLEVRMN